MQTWIREATMIRIAVRMLGNNLSQTLITMVGIGVAFFLTSALTGVLVGWCNTTSAIVRHAGADIWVMAQNTPAFDYGTAIPRRRIYQVRSLPGVARAEGMYLGWNYWQTPDGRQINVELVGIDDSCRGGPWRMKDGTVECVHFPSAVIVDELFLDSLGVSGVGDEAELLSRRAVVRGVCRGVRTFTASPFIFTSLTSALDYDQRYGSDDITYVLVNCTGGIAPEQMKSRIEEQVPNIQALTTDEFALRTIAYWMLQTGAGITVVVTALLGVVVGTVITSQTLFAITQNHLREYAALLALGFHRRQLAGITGAQSLLLGAAGVALGAAGFFVAARLSVDSPIPIETTPLVFLALGGLSLASCVLASFLSVRSIFRIDPILVFRN
jgi:putative ABC transport system permease protein